MAWGSLGTGGLPLSHHRLLWCNRVPGGTGGFSTYIGGGYGWDRRVRNP
jgi:hypothetical protein